MEVCENHPHTVTYWTYADDMDSLTEPVTYSFKVRYKDEDWTFNYELNNYHPGLFIWSEAETPGPRNRDRILHFYPIPDITPENALQKLPTILTFS